MDKKDAVNHVLTMQDDSVARLYDTKAYQETINNVRYFMDQDYSPTAKALHTRLDRMLTSEAEFSAYIENVFTLQKTLFNLNKLLANHLPVTVIDTHYFTGEYDSLKKQLTEKKTSEKQFDKEANKLAKEFAKALNVANTSNLTVANSHGLNIYSPLPEVAAEKPKTNNK